MAVCEAIWRNAGMAHRQAGGTQGVGVYPITWRFVVAGMRSPRASVVADVGVGRVQFQNPMLFSPVAVTRTFLRQDHVECIESRLTNRTNNHQRVCI